MIWLVLDWSKHKHPSGQKEPTQQRYGLYAFADERLSFFISWGKKVAAKILWQTGAATMSHFTP